MSTFDKRQQRRATMARRREEYLRRTGESSLIKDLSSALADNEQVPGQTYYRVLEREHMSLRFTELVKTLDESSTRKKGQREEQREAKEERFRENKADCG
ncbi:hypothetical protein PM082_011941 [Marasmius tenuissimus]|nr:hypothetical protein PM082_011941 [Marasmius tenuissimus]